MIFKTIKGNLIFFITILLAAISLFIFFYFPSRFEQYEINLLSEKASVLNKLSAYSVSPALNFNDPDNIKEVALGIIKNKDIMYLIIEDENDSIKYSYNISLAFSNKYKITSEKPDPAENLLYNTMERVVYRNTDVGKIYAGYTLVSIRQTMLNNRMMIAIISLIIFIIATFIVNIIGRYSLRPLTEITQTARQITHKNLDIRAKESLGEIGELAVAFNLMLEKLQKARVELEDWNRNLEDVVYQRTSDLQKEIKEKNLAEQQLIIAKDKAEEMNRVKSIFFANMSHELRTPLIGILGFTEILLAELTSPDHIEMIELIYMSGKRLSDTLNQILEISKIESDNLEMKLKLHDIGDITEKSMKLFNAAAILNNLQLLSEHKTEKCIALVDDHHFITILENLINNAIKFTKTGKIIVETGIENSGNTRWAYLQVSDTGIGISDEKIGTIFQEFRQVSEGINRKYQGTGLGLTITKKLTELMHGTITVNSELGVGSVFTVKFPAPPQLS
jgi:signal transduction histidine kinase